jgi:hypothetical protein
MDKMWKTLGSWLFLLGILLAVIVGLLVGANVYTDTNGYAALVLALLGFIVGILSFFAVGTITRDEVPTFLIAALLLIGIGAASTLLTKVALIGQYLYWIAVMFSVFIAPAAILLAIRAVWDIGKSAEPVTKH